MTRQIALGYGAPSRADLENRIHALEVKVISLTEAVRLLAGALENASPAGADDDAGDAALAEVAEVARQAHELVLTHHHNGETTTSGEPEKAEKAEKAKKADKPRKSGRQGKPAKSAGQ